MENEYSIYELIEELKTDESLGDDADTRAAIADALLMMISY